MGHRDLKRVAKDFSWPLKTLWKGYVNPIPGHRTCKSCEGTGLNPATRALGDEFYDLAGLDSRWRYVYGTNPQGQPASRPPWKIVGDCRRWCGQITQDEVEALVRSGRLWSLTRVPLNAEQEDIVRRQISEGKNGWLPFDTHMPSAEEVNGWAQQGPGHDGINYTILLKTRAERLGIFGVCQRCKGSGEEKLPRKMKKAFNKWRPTEPPAGEGWQLWDTCSAGMPMSPVFASAPALASWCETWATLIGHVRASKETWLKMFLDGPSGVDAGSLLIGFGRGVFPAATHPDLVR
ncbi:MAG: hypothetical protein Q7R83_03285 [bacterium]|nr:hypothetical protein [bacterium]